MTRLVYILFVFVLIACDTTKKPEAVQAAKVQPTVSGDKEAAKSLIDVCTSCHGKYGEKSFDGAPFLAGQNQQYLVSVMADYVSGKRKHEAMQNLLLPYSEKERRDLAAYFSQSSFAWRTAGILKSDEKDAKHIMDDLTRRGKIIPCASCHGKDGNSINPGAPSLALLEPEYIAIALKGYLSGDRIDPFMTNFKLVLSDVDIDSLAHYFAEHKPKKTQLASGGNVRQGKQASKQCIGCHGLKGNSPVPSLPSLAGQNASYLVAAMQAYKKGTRKNKLMRDAVKNINHKTMVNIAAYYANQTPIKGDDRSQTNNVFAPLQTGENIALVCNGCHGKNGNSTQAGVPSLTRLHPEYIQSAIKNYKNGNRKHALMATLVSYMTDLEIEMVSLYYATQEPAKTRLFGKGSDAEARKIVAQCNNCHGTNGSSLKPKIPTLAGQGAAYLSNAIQAYAKGERKHEDMQKAVKDLSQEDIKNITTYYALQTPLTLEKRTLLSPQELSKKCDRCHGENGFSTDPAIPRLAGQLPSYLEQALLAYKTENREHSMMKVMAEVLSLSEMNAIAEYYYEKGINK